MTEEDLGARLVTATAALVYEHLAEELSVSDLADHVGYSPFHYSRLFTRAAGVAPGQYLTAARIDVAKRLLLDEDAAVVDVATAVGFDSLSSFSRRFRESVGAPPGGLRRLADRIADRPPRPFVVGTGDGPRLRVRLDLGPLASAQAETSIWVGWYPRPAPIGLPRAGVLAADTDEVTVPLVVGAPWLLAFAVPTGADPRAQLAPTTPLVAVHPRPVTAPGTLTLHLGPPPGTSVPLLSALPVLCRS